MGTLVKKKIIYSGGSQQYDEMPNPSEDLLGTIVQFVGTTDANYTNGYFYKCVEVVPATTPKTYKWERHNVQPNGSIDAYTKAETDTLLDEKASLSIAEISTAGGGKEVHATFSQGEDEASVNYYKTTELPDALNLNIGPDSFRLPTAGYVDSKVDDVAGAVPFLATYGTTTYADVVAAIDANKPIVIDFTNNHNLFCVTYSTYGAAGSNVLMYAIYKSANDVTLATITLTSTNVWSITHTNLQDKLVSGTSIKTINNQSLLGGGNIDVGGGTVDTAMSDSSTNAVQNKVIKGYVDNALAAKQDTLVSGTNIKTVNNQSVVGSGNVNIGVCFAVDEETWYGTYKDENGVIYQVYTKTIYIPALPATAGITTYNHGIANIKQILSVYGFTTDGFVLNAPRQNAQDNIAIFQASKSASNQTISIEVGKDRSSKKAYVTLIYAKNN